MMSFDIRQSAFSEEPGLKHVREKVFVEEQQVPLELEWDGEDDSAIHVVAFDTQHRIIGTGRMLADGHIGRMAVLKNWRHKSVGSAMLQALLTIAQQQRLATVYLHAQTSAVGFYSRFGFKVKGEEFMDAGIPHQCMEKTLK